jgi:hypothetical protein
MCSLLVTTAVSGNLLLATSWLNSIHKHMLPVHQGCSMPSQSRQAAQPLFEHILTATGAPNRSGCHWRQTFTLAGRLQYDGPALSRLASEVAEELRVGVQHQAEAEVLLLYLKDTDNGVLALTRAK